MANAPTLIGGTPLLHGTHVYVPSRNDYSIRQCAFEKVVMEKEPWRGGRKVPVFVFEGGCTAWRSECFPTFEKAKDDLIVVLRQAIKDHKHLLRAHPKSADGAAIAYYESILAELLKAHGPEFHSKFARPHLSVINIQPPETA